MSATTSPPTSITRQVVTLPATGLPMEVLTALPTAAASSAPSFPFFAAQPKTRRPLVFVHGSFHSAWCWAEHFLPFFQAQGFPCYAISCRGTSRSPSPDQEKSMRIATHAQDLRAFLQATFPSSASSLQPIVIGHSFGGAILAKMLEQDATGVGGAVFVCSVPPSGNGPMTARFLKRDVVLAFKIVLGFVAKKAAEWDWLCRELFFAPDLDAGLLREYKGRLKQDSVVGIDVKDFLQELPSLQADPATGQARWVGQVPHRFVLGQFLGRRVRLGQPQLVHSPHDPTKHTQAASLTRLWTPKEWRKWQPLPTVEPPCFCRCRTT